MNAIPSVKLNFGPYGGQVARNTTGLPSALDNPAGTPASPAAGGFTPNYALDLGNDPLFLQLQKQVAAQNQAAQGAATTGFGQELAGYGQIPDLNAAASELGINASSPLYALLKGAVSDPNTVAAAQNLTSGGLSTEAQLGTQHQTALGDLMSNLAARGAVQSGDTGTGLRLEDQANSQRQYDAQQTLLQHLASIANTYNTQQQQGISQLQQGAAQAAGRQIALNPSVPSALATTIMQALAPSTTATTGGSSGGLG